MYSNRGTALSKTHRIPSGQVSLEGELRVPEGATGVVLFAHGSGSSRHSPRNQFVYGQLRCEKELKIVTERRSFLKNQVPWTKWRILPLIGSNDT